MPATFVSRVGGIISADIAVPEHEREVRFYAQVLTTGDHPLWRDDLMNRDGTPVIGLGERIEAYESLPLQWMPHIQVADVAQSVERALELGGEELMHGKDDDGNSLWAAVRDPNGAAFGLIPVVPPEAIPAPAESDAPDDAPAAGTIAWVDLTVADTAATRDFYRAVVGWTVQDTAMKDGDEAYADYTMLGGDGEAAAGVCHARGSNTGLPETWLLYLPVGDLTESLRRASADGGEVIKTYTRSDGSTTMAVVRDPVGVAFALIQA